MRPKHPPYVHAFRDQYGERKPRYYFRRPGFKRVPLPGLPWSPMFMAAHEQAMAGQWEQVPIGSSRTVPGTVNAAIISYLGSQDFTTALAPGTQISRRAILERFREQHGDKRMAGGEVDRCRVQSGLA
jgi:hypothetical protein